MADDQDRAYEIASADFVLPLTRAELGLVVEALDSHAYWQLSDPNYRDSGYVQDPGSDDPEAVDALNRVNELHDRLEAMLHATPADDDPEGGAQ